MTGRILTRFDQHLISTRGSGSLDVTSHSLFNRLHIRLVHSTRNANDSLFKESTIIYQCSKTMFRHLQQFNLPDFNG